MIYIVLIGHNWWFHKFRTPINKVMIQYCLVVFSSASEFLVLAANILTKTVLLSKEKCISTMVNTSASSDDTNPSSTTLPKTSLVVRGGAIEVSSVQGEKVYDRLFIFYMLYSNINNSKYKLRT